MATVENTIPVTPDAGKSPTIRNTTECAGPWDTTHCDWQPRDMTPSVDRSVQQGATSNHCRRCAKLPQNEERARVVNDCDELGRRHHADAERNAALVFGDVASGEMVSGWIDEARAKSAAARVAADILRASGYLDAPTDELGPHAPERLIASLRVRGVDGRYPPVPDIDPPWGAPGIEPTVPGFYWILPWVCATDTDPGYPIGDPHVGLLKVDEYDSDGRALSPPVWHELTDGVVACAGVAAPHPGRCAFRFMPMNAPTVP